MPQNEGISEESPEDEHIHDNAETLAYTLNRPPPLVFILGAALQWVPDVLFHARNTPFFIVGTNIDLRDNTDTLNKLTEQGERPVTEKEGRQLAQRLRASKYLECSALTLKDLDKVFEEVILTLSRPPPGNRTCVMM